MHVSPLRKKKKQNIDFQVVTGPTIGNNFQLFKVKDKKNLYSNERNFFSLSTRKKKNGSHLPLLSDSAFTFSQVIAIIIYDYESVHPNDMS